MKGGRNLDRGMVYCIAHIRGGGEMGRYWYEEQGKYLNKRNTFQDFISCAERTTPRGQDPSVEWRQQVQAADVA